MTDFRPLSIYNATKGDSVGEPASGLQVFFYIRNLFFVRLIPLKVGRTDAPTKEEEVNDTHDLCVCVCVACHWHIDIASTKNKKA